jgi:hypothetical protein
MKSNPKKNQTQKTIKKRNNQTQKLQLKDHHFTQEEYNSNDGMLTTVWGPGTWHFLHTTSFNYPVHPTPIEKRHYMDFIKHLQYVLPCGKCRKNLKHNFEKLPLHMCHMKNRDTFSRYIYELHEVVNTMLNKRSYLTYDDVRKRYENFRSRCAKSLKNVKRLKLHKGCTEPLYGEKSKCVLHIVPQTKKCDSFQVDDTCIKKEMIV